MKPPAKLEIPPVVLLVFRRPDLTRRVIAALRAVRPPKIFIVADGPRPGVPDDAARCAEVRAVCENEIDWKPEIRREFAETNRSAQAGVVRSRLGFQPGRSGDHP